MLEHKIILCHPLELCCLPASHHTALCYANILYTTLIQLLAAKVGLGIGAMPQPFIVRHLRCWWKLATRECGMTWKRHLCNAKIAIVIGMSQEKSTSSENFCRFWQTYSHLWMEVNFLKSGSFGMIPNMNKLNAFFLGQEGNFHVIALRKLCQADVYRIAVNLWLG